MLLKGTVNWFCSLEAAQRRIPNGPAYQETWKAKGMKDWQAAISVWTYWQVNNCLQVNNKLACYNNNSLSAITKEHGCHKVMQNFLGSFISYTNVQKLLSDPESDWKEKVYDDRILENFTVILPHTNDLTLYPVVILTVLSILSFLTGLQAYAKKYCILPDIITFFTSWEGSLLPSLIV